MNLSRQITQVNCPFLTTSGRKRTVKDQLIHVQRGHALFKLGKTEYHLGPSQCFWLPRTCLTAVTFLPNTSYVQVALSVRLKQSYPTQAGYVALPDLDAQLLVALPNESNDETKTLMLKLLSSRLAHVNPVLKQNDMSRQIEDFQSGKPTSLGKDITEALLARDGKKMQQSGATDEMVASNLFDNNLEHWHQLKEKILG